MYIGHVLAMGRYLIPSILALSAVIFSGLALVSSPGADSPGEGPQPSMVPVPSDNTKTTVVGAIDFSPSVLNIHSGGKYVTVRLTLPEDVPVSSVYIPSVRFMGTVYAETCFSDHETGAEKTNAPHLVLKFLRADVAAVLAEGQDVQVFVTGMLVDGTPLYASGALTVTV